MIKKVTRFGMVVSWQGAVAPELPEWQAASRNVIKLFGQPLPPRVGSGLRVNRFRSDPGAGVMEWFGMEEKKEHTHTVECGNDDDDEVLAWGFSSREVPFSFMQWEMETPGTWSNWDIFVPIYRNGATQRVCGGSLVDYDIPSVFGSFVPGRIQTQVKPFASVGWNYYSFSACSVEVDSIYRGVIQR